MRQRHLSLRSLGSRLRGFELAVCAPVRQPRDSKPAGRKISCGEVNVPAGMYLVNSPFVVQLRRATKLREVSLELGRRAGPRSGQAFSVVRPITQCRPAKNWRFSVAGFFTSQAQEMQRSMIRETPGESEQKKKNVLLTSQIYDRTLAHGYNVE